MFYRCFAGTRSTKATIYVIFVLIYVRPFRNHEICHRLHQTFRIECHSHILASRLFVSTGHGGPVELRDLYNREILS